MITTTRKNKYSVEVADGRHILISDIKKDLGGDDAGLDAHELLEASLGACTVQTLLLYAGRKGWDLKDLKVEVNILSERGASTLERNIYFGDIPDEQKKRLLEIADKCPIHKLLIGNIEIKTFEKAL